MNGWVGFHRYNVGEYTSTMGLMGITFLSVRIVWILRFFDCLVLLSWARGNFSLFAHMGFRFTSDFSNDNWIWLNSGKFTLSSLEIERQKVLVFPPRCYTLENERGKVHLKSSPVCKGKSSKSNLHDVGFQPLIFQGVPYPPWNEQFAPARLLPTIHYQVRKC